MVTISSNNNGKAIKMTEIIQKISSYNIFNYLFPGVLFCVLVDRFTQYAIMQNNILFDIFVCYFVGLCMSRIGSLIVEPYVDKNENLKICHTYREYLNASKKDDKIRSFVEVANMYRTILSMFLIFCIVKIYEVISIKYQINSIIEELLLLIGFMVLFLCSYIKQSGYITKRINSANGNKETENDNS